ncbi:hypothetical protein HR45_17560 [Shewanella mangrovi]|uniref:cyclic-guanylate-specific phosphodiesterase n=1 Tax=Shewanella mangrovi TaxID=1515746 RepID=A0A094JAB8_9GAMM|nr:EAL domain-containing protein [Shewanella mangrovi]KFZ36197.1 hypothetical protein HR45_17560 [Shewanella mangrovi]
MKRLLLFPLLLILLCNIAPVQAQDDFIQRIFTAREGLGSYNINSLAEDQDGFVWLATQDGLYRISNSVIRRIDRQEGQSLLDEQYLTLVRPVGEHKLLVSSEYQTYLYDVAANRFHKLAELPQLQQFQDGAVLRAQQLEDGSWILLTDKGSIWRLAQGASAITKLFTLPENKEFYWSRLQLVGDKLLLGNGKHLGLYNLQGELLKDFPWDEQLGWIAALYQDQQQRIWIGGRYGLYQADIANSKLHKVPTLPYKINDIVDDGNGNLWVVANTGLLKYHPDSGVVENYTKRLTQKVGIESVSWLMLDHHNLLWLTGPSQPLAIATDAPTFIKDKIQIKNDTNQLVATTWSLLRQQHHLWLGGDGNLSQFDLTSHTAKRVTFTSLKPSDSIYVMQPLDEQHLLLGTTNGLAIVDTTTLSEVPATAWLDEQQLRGQVVFDLFLHADQWFISTTAGLFRWQPAAKTLQQLTLPRAANENSRLIYKVSADKQQRIWVVGDSTFGYFDGDRFISKHDDLQSPQLPSPKISQMMQVGTDEYWLASRETGLLQYNLNTQQVSHLSDDWQIDCRTVYFVTQTDDFRIAGCANKIIRQNKLTGDVSLFDNSDGLIAKDLNEGAMLMDPQYGLFVGTPSGTMLLDVAKMKKRVPDIHTILESVAVYYDDDIARDLAPKANMVVNPGAKLVNFQLSNFDYLQQDNFSFQYRIKKLGTTAENKYLLLENQTQINIAGLSAGQYLLEVIGKNNGLWELQPLQFPFVVHLYWWEAPWFKFLLLTALLLALISIIIYRHHQVKRFQTINSALVFSDERLRQALRGSESDLWEWHHEDDCLYMQNHGNVLHSELPELVMKVPDLPLHPDDRSQVEEQWFRMLKGEQEFFDCEYRYRTAEGTWGWLKVRGRPVNVNNETGEVLKVAGIYSDITETRVLENEVTLLARAFENTTEGVLILDALERVEVSNQAAESLLGLSDSQISGMPVSEVIFRHDGGKATVIELLDGSDTWTGERDFITHDQQHLPVWLNVSIIKNERQQLQYFVLVFSDISERKQSEAELRKLANFDVLTGLPNRSLFANRLEKAMMRADDQQQKLALLFLDLDRFKQVNDSYGHSMGDALLVEAANRLQSVLRKDEILCRFGGDEFVVLVNSGDIDYINRICEAMLEQISSPFKLFGREFFISTSIGISIWPDDTRQSETLIKNADQAMYHAKDEGRGNFQYYSRERNAEALYHLRLEGDLRKAIEHNQFELHYQGQFDLLQDDRMTGVEALLRWKHPHDGYVRPDIFIKVAESCGLIVDIDRWVLQQACVDGACWSQADDSFRMSVNISAVHFRQPDFIDTLSQILKQTGMPAEQLTLEITEGVLMKELHVARQHLQQLRSMGIEVAIDDFGTGYSSLAYLRHFEVNTLKVDRSFLIDIASNSADQAIVSSIIELARNLKLKVVAEGVETREQLEQVFSRGCYVIQGYYFCKPMPAAALMAWLAERDAEKQ